MARRRKRSEGWFDRIAKLVVWAGAAVAKRNERAAETRATGRADALDGMTWREFEPLVAEAFRLQGYQVAERSGGPAHRGADDLVLRRDRQTYLVRCKEWQARKVGAGVVHELQRVMAARGAAGGFILTAGRFSREAAAFAGGSGIRLIEGPGLLGMIRQARASRAGVTPAIAQQAN